MYKTILVPLDGSELSETALVHAVALAKPLQAQLVLMHVVVFITRDFDVIPMEAAASAEVMAEAKRYLERAAGNLRRSGVTVTTFVASGRVADTIVAYAVDHGVDLIVMSTHGRTGAARWIIGSVADRVVHSAPVPVLVVRPQNKG
jgi:nucleotide-binding universal stress UspA family protein